MPKQVNGAKAQTKNMKNVNSKKIAKVNKGSLPQVGVAAAYSSGQRQKAPDIRSSKDEVRVIHRELLGSISGTGAFTQSQAVALNPGLSSSFPWLSIMAQSWERYRFNRLRFCYYTRCGTTTAGSVLMVPDYDASDVAPFSEQIASSYEDVQEDAPWKDIHCELRPAALHALGPTKFIRTSGLLANQDVKTYDAGNFFVFTTDGSAVNWGKLWVEYDVTLMTPQMNPSGGGVIGCQAISCTNPTSASILGTQGLTPNSSNFVTVVGEVVTFTQAGQFLVVYSVTGTTCTQTGAGAAGAGGAIIVAFTSGSATAAMAQWFQITAVVGSTLTFNNTLVAGTASSFSVTQIPSFLGQI